jgi:hypothetical protein
LQHDLRIGPKNFAGSEARQQRVCDLTRRPGDGDANDIGHVMSPWFAACGLAFARRLAMALAIGERLNFDTLFDMNRTNFV